MSTPSTTTLPATPDLDDSELVPATDYPLQSVEWLWPGRIPVGKVTLLVGDPGLGKSLIAVDIAARVTRGTPFPTTGGTPGASSNGRGLSQLNDTPNPTPCAAPRNVLPIVPPNPEPRTLNPPDSLPPAPGSVLILSAEDQISDTIRPRLAAHGADDARVFFAPKITDLRHDLAKIEQMLDRLPDCRLIVVDPVNAYVGASDSHFHTVVRKVLAPLTKLADRKRVAILAVTHLRKNAGYALQRATGSMGFVASARTVWSVAPDPENPGRNLLLPIKNNLRPLGDGLAYSIAPHDSLDAPVLCWDTRSVCTTTEDAFASPSTKRGPDPIECRAAADWLAITLAPGPRRASRIIDEGRSLGFQPRTLRRALHSIGGQTGFGGRLDGWTWSLPAPPPTETQSPLAPSATTDSHQTTQPTACTNPQPAISNPQSASPNPQPPSESSPLSQASKKPVPLKETCPLTENNAIPTAPPHIPLPATAPSTPRPPHPLNGHPVISQILWPLRNPPPVLKAQPPQTKPQSPDT